MGGMIADYYQSVMDRYHFIPDKNTGSFNPAGMYWWLSPEIGEGGYWVYAWKDLFDIKIHDFFFYQDIFMEFELPSCLSYTQYDSISGKELASQHCLSAGCIKTFVSSRDPYKVLVHKEVPVRSVGIEIMPAYYEDYLKMRYPDSYDSPLPAFRKMDGADKFPEMARLLWQMKTYRGSGIAASLFYEGKIAEAVAFIMEAGQQRQKARQIRLPEQDISALNEVAAYLDSHYASKIPLERLAKIACMGTTKLKTSFKQFHGCTITEYIQKQRINQAKDLLVATNLTVGQVTQAVGYSTSSRFARLFCQNTGVLPVEYRRMAREK